MREDPTTAILGSAAAEQPQSEDTSRWHSVRRGEGWRRDPSGELGFRQTTVFDSFGRYSGSEDALGHDVAWYSIAAAPFYGERITLKLLRTLSREAPALFCQTSSAQGLLQLADRYKLVRTVRLLESLFRRAYCRDS